MMKHLLLTFAIFLFHILTSEAQNNARITTGNSTSKASALRNIHSASKGMPGSGEGTFNNGAGTVVVYGNIVNNGTFLNTGAGSINLSGDWQNNGTYTPGGETVSFAGTSTQNIIGSSVTTFNNLTLNNTNGITLSGNTGTVVTGILALLNGRFSLGSKNLTLGTGSTISVSNPSNAKMIVPDGTGKLIKNFGTSGLTSFTFPVGDYLTAHKYTPVTITATTGNFNNAVINLNLKDTKDPNELSYPNYVSRYWDISNTGSGTFTYTVELNYDPADITGTESVMQCAKYSGTSWTYHGFVTTTGGQHKILIPGLTSFSRFSAFGYAATASGNGPVCSGQTLSLSSGPGSKASYEWSGPNSFTSTSQNPSISNVTTAASGTYNVTVTDASTFSAVASTVVTINALPNVTWPGTLPSQCINSTTYNLTGGTPSGGIYSGDGVTANNFNAVIAGEGTHTLTYTYTDNNGCVNSKTNTITVYPFRSITGTFSYYNLANTPLTTNITVGLYQGGGQIGSDYLVTTGSFLFSNLCPGIYEVRASSTLSTDGSVNTTDAAQVNNWGVVPYSIEKVRFYAGDVTLGKWLNATDAQRIQQYFVTAGSTSFDRSPWTFWKTGELINLNPPSAPDYPTVEVTGNANVTANFYGLCTGDFNRSFDPSAKKSGTNCLQLIYGSTRQIGRNEEFDLPVQMVNTSRVGAISLAMNLPTDLADVKDIFLNGTGGRLDWAVKDNELRIGWNSLASLDMEAGMNLLILRLKTTDAFSEGTSIRLVLASNPLNELADDQYAVIGDAIIRVDVIEASGAGTDEQTSHNRLTLNNYPNPVSSYTIISYILPFEGRVRLEIRNLLGETVKVLVNETQTKGDHSFRFDVGTFRPGIYTETIRLSGSDELTRTIKMVISR